MLSLNQHPICKGLADSTALTGLGHALTIKGVAFAALPPRSMVGQLPLEQHIGVRIPGGQPTPVFKVVYRRLRMSEEVQVPLP